MILKRLVKRRLLTFSFYGRCKLAWRTMNQQRYLCPLEILLTIFFVQLVLFLVSHPLFFIYMFLTSFVYTIEVVWENSNTVTEINWKWNHKRHLTDIFGRVSYTVENDATSLCEQKVLCLSLNGRIDNKGREHKRPNVQQEKWTQSIIAPIVINTKNLISKNSPSSTKYKKRAWHSIFFWKKYLHLRFYFLATHLWGVLCNK